MKPPSHDLSSSVGATIPAALEASARSAPGKGFTFLRAGEAASALRFPALLREANRRGRALHACGLRPGDRLALILADNEAFVLSFLGALCAGIVPVPMVPPMSMGRLDGYIETARKILEVSGARCLLCDRRTQAVLWSLVDQVPSLERLRCVEQLPERDGELPEVRPDDVAFLQFTSGSTSSPKGVVVTHRSLMANLHGIMRHGLVIDPACDVAVSWLPMYHDMGLIGFMLAPACYGVETCYIPTLEFVRRPTRWLETVDRWRGTVTFAPNFAFALARRRTPTDAVARLDLSCLRVLGCGAEPNHPHTLRRFLEHFAPARLSPNALMPCYGMAEATLAVSFCRLNRPLKTERLDAARYQQEGLAVCVGDDPGDVAAAVEVVSCGHVLPDHQVEVLSDDGRPLPDRHVGELRVTGPSLARGYHGLPEASAEAFTPDGLLTGDLGYLSDGELFVTGRKKDLIILNGRNHDPQSIEWAAAEVPGVREGNVVAFAVSGEQTERLVVVAELRPDADAEPDAIAALLKMRVSEALFVAVDDVALVARGALPKTSSGKPQRGLTRTRYLDGTLETSGLRTPGASGSKRTLGKHLARSFISRARHEIRTRVRPGPTEEPTDG